MNRPILLFALFSLIILSSCQKKTIFREFHEFENYQWGRFDKVKFEIPIENEGISADITLAVRHLDVYPYNDLPINLILTTPTGEERIIEKTIVLKDESGKFKGSVAGSYWDQEEVLWKSFYFNRKGTYILELENINPKPAIPGLVDIGLLIRKNK